MFRNSIENFIEPFVISCICSGPPTIRSAKPAPLKSPAEATIYRLWMNAGTDQLSGVQLFSIPDATVKAAPSLWFVATTPY